MVIPSHHKIFFNPPVRFHYKQADKQYMEVITSLHFKTSILFLTHMTGQQCSKSQVDIKTFYIFLQVFTCTAIKSLLHQNPDLSTLSLKHMTAGSSPGCLRCPCKNSSSVTLRSLNSSNHGYPDMAASKFSCSASSFRPCQPYLWKVDIHLIYP